MLQNAYLLAKSGADTSESEQHAAARCAGAAAASPAGRPTTAGRRGTCFAAIRKPAQPAAVFMCYRRSGSLRFKTELAHKGGGREVLVKERMSCFAASRGDAGRIVLLALSTIARCVFEGRFSAI